MISGRAGGATTDAIASKTTVSRTMTGARPTRQRVGRASSVSLVVLVSRR
jgi:hypothetical protein